MEHGYRRIPNRLKRYRKIAGYTQAEVAGKLGFKKTGRITEWEQGRAMPSAKHLLQLSILYKTFPNQLYQELTMEFTAELFSQEKIKKI